VNRHLQIAPGIGLRRAVRCFELKKQEILKIQCNIVDCRSSDLCFQHQCRFLVNPFHQAIFAGNMDVGLGNGKKPAFARTCSDQAQGRPSRTYGPCPIGLRSHVGQGLVRETRKRGTLVSACRLLWHECSISLEESANEQQCLSGPLAAWTGAPAEFLRLRNRDRCLTATGTKSA